MIKNDIGRCFLNAIAQISCQEPLSDTWFSNPIFYEEKFVRSKEADTKEFLAPAEARRMSKILKRAICTSLSALRIGNVSNPDAIITGTGMGCMENSEKFLIDMAKFGESCLKPTLFMQSTHNTISSQIAITLNCNGYNNTYSHKGISFVSALLDAFIQIRGGLISNALIGAHDEVTPLMFQITRHIHPEYGFVSETSVSALLNNEITETTICEISEVKLFHRPEIEELRRVCSENEGTVYLLGVNGNALNDAPYYELLDSVSFKPQIAIYKNIFGDNFSSSALAFYVGAKLIEKQIVPTSLTLNNNVIKSEIKSVVIINHSDNTTWSVVRLNKI